MLREFSYFGVNYAFKCIVFFTRHILPKSLTNYEHHKQLNRGANNIYVRNGKLPAQKLEQKCNADIFFIIFIDIKSSY